MPTLITGPAYLEATGNKVKVIEEFVGRVCTGDKDISIARMRKLIQPPRASARMQASTMG